ncbi:MAG: hypothetical protein ACKOFD_06630 [Actinomycetota bacterium]
MKRISILISAAILSTALFIPAPASAHVGVYVAGVSGLAVNASGGTYEVSFAPGHGCSGPRTAANPDGEYDTTSLEVFMPRSSTGNFIFPEVRAVNRGGYRATVKTTADPTNPTLKRVSSIVFDQFVLPAVNNDYAARDTLMLGITVKLPTLTQLRSYGLPVAAGNVNTAEGAKVYFPSMQYCDVTGLGVGVQGAGSVAAPATASFDAKCSESDSIVSALYDDWTTSGNTPSITIGTSTTNIVEFSGNKPTKTASSLTYCRSVNGAFARSTSWSGEFTLSLKNARLGVMSGTVDDRVSKAGAQYQLRLTSGAKVGTVTLDANGNSRFTMTSTGIKRGTLVGLYDKRILLATDEA